MPMLFETLQKFEWTFPSGWNTTARAGDDLWIDADQVNVTIRLGDTDFEKHIWLWKPWSHNSPKAACVHILLYYFGVVLR